MAAMEENLSVGVECTKYRKYLDAEATVEAVETSSGEVEATATNERMIHTFEDLLALARTNGIWNYSFVFLMFLCRMPAAFIILSYQFLGYTPEYWCHIQELHDANWTNQQIIDFAIPRKADGELERCLQRDYNYSLAASMGYEVAKNNPDLVTNVKNGTVSCPERDFNLRQYSSTLVTDFDLVCERRALYSTTTSVTHLGIFVASLIVGYGTDQFGKRRFILACQPITISFGALMAMSPNVETYLLGKFLQVVFYTSANIAIYTLVMELSFSNHRAWTNVSFSIPWALGQMLLPTIAYFVREWQYLQIIFVASCLHAIIYYWILPESPRWLILRGRHEEAIGVLKTIAYWNKRDLPSDEVLLEMVKRTNIKGDEEQNNQEGGTKREWLRRGLDQLEELFQSRVKTARTLVLFYSSFTSAVVYYGISLISTNIGANEYWYMFFGGLVEGMTDVILGPLVHYAGRRLALIGSLSLCAASNFGVLGVADSQGWKTTLSLLCKSGIGAACSVVRLLTAETNTTKSRTLALAMISAVAHLGSMISPYINDLLGSIYPAAPSAVFGALSCTAAFLAFSMPETRKTNLPESRSDVENMNPG